MLSEACDIIIYHVTPQSLCGFLLSYRSQWGDPWGGGSCADRPGVVPVSSHDGLGSGPLI